MTDRHRDDRGSHRGLPTFGARARVLAWFVLLMSVAILASLFFLRQVLLSRLDDQIAADLRQEVGELRQLVGGRAPDGSCVTDVDTDGECDIGRDPESGEPFGNDIESIFDTFLRRNLPGEYETMLSFVHGEPFEVPFVEPPVALVDDHRFRRLGTLDASVDGAYEVKGVGTVRYLAVPVAGAGGQPLGVFVVAAFADLQREELSTAWEVAAAVLVAALLFASAAAWLSAGRVLAPLRMVTRTARTITDSDLSERIPVTGNDEISELARTFNQMLDRLEDAFGTQRAFIDDAGHELRTPITIVRGHLELLSDDPQERRETLALVTDELDRMARMVNDLLVLAKAERPDFLDLSVVDAEELLAAVQPKLTALGDRAWRLDSRVRGHIRADRHRLTQALLQLGQNAVQHTAPGDVVVLGSRMAAAGVEFTVRDPGPGVAPQDAERIFRRFTRGMSGSRRTEGAGLGLWIVAAIAAAHGGHVRVEPVVGRGAHFVVWLPARTSDLMPTGGAPRAAAVLPPVPAALSPTAGTASKGRP